jgi:hypothetical protein
LTIEIAIVSVLSDKVFKRPFGPQKKSFKNGKRFEKEKMLLHPEKHLQYAVYR